jgi:type I restriction enzyme, S subunit
MSDELTELPEGWEWIKLSDVEEKIGSGATPRGGAESYKLSGIPLIRSMNVHFAGLKLDGLAYLDDKQADELKNVEVKANDVLLNITGASIGRVTQASPEMDGARVNQHVCIIRTNPILDAGFLSRYIASPTFQKWIIAEEYGATRQALTKQMILNFDIPLPPLNEQKRIVAKIEELNDRTQRAKEALETIPQLCDRFRQSVLAAAFRGDLTADWRRQDNEEFLDSNFPSTWNKGELGNVVEGLKQGWSPKCEIFPSPIDDIWGVIKTTAVQSLSFIEGENKQLPSHLEPRPELEVIKGDLLITRAGPRARAGVTCLVSSVRPKLMICDKVYRFRAKESYVLPLYLAYFLNSPSAISLIDELKTGISDSGVNLTQEKFLALPLQFPPIAEQQEIVNRVKSLFKITEEIEQQYQKAKANLDQLNQSILAKAFRGELVPQDPDDEPASVLLERIRAEREKLNNGKQKSQRTSKRKSKTIEEQEV